MNEHRKLAWQNSTAMICFPKCSWFTDLRPSLVLSRFKARYFNKNYSWRAILLIQEMFWGWQKTLEVCARGVCPSWYCYISAQSSQASRVPEFIGFPGPCPAYGPRAIPLPQQAKHGLSQIPVNSHRISPLRLERARGDMVALWGSQLPSPKTTPFHGDKVIPWRAEESLQELNHE